MYVFCVFDDLAGIEISLADDDVRVGTAYMA
jgi:hypothetical protein